MRQNQDSESRVSGRLKAKKMATTILLVEDEAAIAETVIYALRSEGYAVEHRMLIRDALAALRERSFDVVVVDVGLPDGSGLDLCRELRGFSAVPVIFLTARGDETDRVVGLEIGADDYVVKPFSPRELVARVRVCLRRTAAARPVQVPDPEVQAWAAIGDFAHDRAGRRVRYAGQRLELTRYEYGLLRALLARPGAILSRAQLMDDIWRDAPDSADRTVDTHVKTLRAKLRAVRPDADPIRTHRGLGYSLDVEP